MYIYIYMYIYVYISLDAAWGDHAYRTAYGRPAVSFLLINFPKMSNVNIVCNTNIDHILKVDCFSLIINKYTKKLVS